MHTKVTKHTIINCRNTYWSIFTIKKFVEFPFCKKNITKLRTKCCKLIFLAKLVKNYYIEKVKKLQHSNENLFKAIYKLYRGGGETPLKRLSF